MAGKEKKEKKLEINFSSLAEDVGKFEEKQHIDQIGPALTDVFIKHSKYKDKTGVIRFKNKFNKNEAENIVNDTYDALGYHSHRRIFGLKEKDYEELKKFKDENGNPYTDILTQYHYGGLDRQEMKKDFASEEENNINHKDLEKKLHKHIEHHKELLLKGLISKSGLKEPEHRDKVISAIERIVDKYHLSKKIKKDLKSKGPEELAGTYISLAMQTYQQENA